MTELDPTVTWRRREHDVAAVDDGVGRVALLDLTRPADPPLLLEGVAASVWRSLGGDGCTLEALVFACSEVYDADPDLMKRELTTFLADLASRGLVVSEAPDA